MVFHCRVSDRLPGYSSNLLFGFLEMVRNHMGGEMKNPCDLCIVKVNCTQICWEKENNQTLLRNAIQQVMTGTGVKRKINPKFLNQYQTYQGLYNECLTDIAEVQYRAREAKGETP